MLSSNNATIGFAKKRFLKKEEDQQIFSFIDTLVAEQIGSFDQSLGEKKLLQYLSLASRQGHLCIVIEKEKKLLPSLQSLLGENVASKKLSNKTLALYEQDVAAAACKDSVIIGDPSEKKALIRIEKEGVTRLYFQRNWILEKEFLQRCKTLLQQTPTLSVDQKKLETLLMPFLEKETLLPEQAQALRIAAQRSLTIITGGPGTGKSYTAGLLVAVLYQALEKDWEVAVAAPTGKAAANLRSSLQKGVSKEANLLLPEAKTLHSLLGIKRSAWGDRQHKTLSADIVIVDETSMADVRMLLILFASLKPGSRLILLGDPAQLPPVETGSLFADIVDALEEDPEKDVVCRLKKCLRIERKEIIDFAQAIKDVDYPYVKRALHQENQDLFYKNISFENDNFQQQREPIIDAVVEKMPKKLLKDSDLLAAFHHFRLLSPLRQGAFGVDSLNDAIAQKILSTISAGEKYALPIVIVNNDHQLKLYNGESGVLVQTKHYKKDLLQAGKRGDYALFSDANSDSGYRKVPAFLLPKFELAYALSVHKSQGAEFEDVLLLLPPGAALFGREVFYTAATRAKKKLSIYSNEEIVMETVSRSSRRLSGIQAETRST